MSSYKFDSSKLMPWATIKERLAAIAATTPADVLASNPPTVAVIATCGSFNPITTAHVGMLEAAKQYLDGGASSCAVDGLPSAAPSRTTVAVGAFVSPVNDKYAKTDLAPFAHRRAICEASLSTSTFAAVDSWEGLQDECERTFTVLSHIRREVRAFYASSATSDEDVMLANNIELYFLCGGDLFESFYHSGVWDLSLLEKIFREFRLLVVAREGSKDPFEIIASHLEPLTHPSTPDAKLDLRLYRDRVHVIRIRANTISSTQVRDSVRAGASVDEMVTPEAAKYLSDNKVY